MKQRISVSLASMLLAAALLPQAAHADIVVKNQVQSTTPTAVGYNLSYFREGSNTTDWWRYAGVKNARSFVGVNHCEPSDDIPGTGDGITTKDGFIARQAALRANASNPAVALDNQYVNWPYFKTNVDASGDAHTVSYTFPQLRSLGIEILANISATASRFPLTSNTQYANMWELWQHYYAVSFILSRDYDVRRYGIYNEPDLTSLTIDLWQLRLRVTSDAIRAGVADMNARYGRNLVVEIFAPNTSNSSYDDDPGEDWGHQTVINRKVDMWGNTIPGRKNLDVYNYQKYTALQYHNGTYSGFVDNCSETKAKIATDMPGETPLPIALTEMNSRGAANYDGSENNTDTPFDYAALAASAIGLANECGAGQLYLFKFGMSIAPSSYHYEQKLVKNGVHYVNGTEGGVNNYGGAAGSAEVWRLFNKAAGSARSTYQMNSDQPSDVWMMTTRDPVNHVTYVYLSNKTTSNATVNLNMSALGIADGSLVTLEEVGPNSRGAVVKLPALSGGRIEAGTLPSYTVWLLSIYEGSAVTASVVPASDDAQLRDGKGKGELVVNPKKLIARAEGAPNKRRVALLKFPVSPGTLAGKRVLLQLSAAQTDASATPAQIHVYGINNDNWNSASSTWKTLPAILKQGVKKGQLIEHNVVQYGGTISQIQGQLMASSTTGEMKYIDVTDFVKSQADGHASFLLVQDHRWDDPSNALADAPPVGDKQASGIVVDSRFGKKPPTLLVY